MKKVVAIRHVNFENLGILGSLLSLRGYQIDYYDAGRDDIRAINNENVDLLVVLGGPISAAQHFSGELRYDFLDHQLALVQQRMARRQATLGVCLGAQVVAQALGADVVSLGVKEIGYAPLTLAADGDSVLAPLADTPVLHWHGDMFMIPAGARRLAGTAVCPHQAFDYQDFALGLQFHLEADYRDIERWLIGHACELAQAGIDPQDLRDQAERHGPRLEQRARQVFQRWLDKYEQRK
ncbi:glutamine amidotransferase [Serratia ficaria]|uniref:Glutamine amidotransferase n=1 Tax=Serratia ficaria TaxID=61651 RepID=A0A240C495_SERFI|nr:MULTISPECIES: glutamine amidotransferase [Serratia]MEE4482108.1 glutamine amidotransferase [Serratia ficaria]REF44615.1 GMP synthase (glutamine-hydrolysing) [Serratia ficaria]CAI0712824.1 glutamine amidotransferase [Serratia ficaria]CAI0757334.1 glutamine amidotransferase [Serratia ficaria]CAI0794166.1 glutamine amidotransferase [Serratia ficaria]